MIFRPKGWEKLSEESYTDLWAFLGDDAEARLESIRSGLVRVFTYRGSRDPEGLADETIDRVASKSGELDKPCVDDPSPLFLRYAHYVFLESVRGARREETLPKHLPAAELDSEESDSLMHRCLEECLGALDREEKGLILDYYRHAKSAKIDHRKELAKRLSKSANALRITACRIRTVLRRCVLQCTQAKTPTWDEA